MQPTIYSAAAHHVRKEHIDPDALYILTRLLQAGYLSYLVGGSVRDLLMGHTPKDFDISTAARPEEIKRLFRNCLLIGRRFRLAHIRFGRKIFEVSTFRAGDTDEDSLILRDNRWGNPEQDVLRRDFTINGLFYFSENDTIIDYVDGHRDLSKRLLRTIGPPEVRFKQDPVRMIRLLKFKARYGFAVTPETWQALHDCLIEIQKSSPARVLEELFKMLESGASAPFFRLMAATGLLDYILPQFAAFLKSEPGQMVLRYLEQVDQIVIRSRRRISDRAVLSSALFFPLIDVEVRLRHGSQSNELSDIASLTNQLLDQIFIGAFAALPKRLHATLSFILNAQYRLTPLDDKKPYRSRIIHHPDFPLALQFLYIRSLACPELKEHYTYWHEIATAPRHPRKRKREEGKSPAEEEFLETL